MNLELLNEYAENAGYEPVDIIEARLLPPVRFGVQPVLMLIKVDEEYLGHFDGEYFVTVGHLRFNRVLRVELEYQALPEFEGTLEECKVAFEDKPIL
jgi:hypothetical protein